MLATFFLGEHNVGQESHLPSDNKSWCLYNLVLNLNKSCAWVRKESGEGISPVQIPPTSSEKPSRSAGSGCPGHAMHPSPETQWLTVEPPTPSYRKVLLRIARRLLFWPWCSGSWTLALFFTVDTCFDQPPLALVTNSEPFPCFFSVLFFFYRGSSLNSAQSLHLKLQVREILPTVSHCPTGPRPPGCHLEGVDSV